MPEAFPGEHLLPGYLGQFFILLSFVSSLLSMFGFYKSIYTSEAGDRGRFLKLAKTSYFVHFASIIGIFLCLFYIIFNHYFEYFYAWRHSSMNLPVKYILSSFWEGSEGSFLLWMFWQALLGLIVLNGRNELNSRVMVVVNLVQALLATMVLGFYFGEIFHIGSNPFRLLRHEMSDAPVFAQPDYLSRIKDGNGLNPLLQNYWMTIHPPVLFLGFAMTLFPFAYAIAALWRNDYRSFVKPALRWSLATGAFLGLGIMMGGAWAYESLTFGGYWAWDPVENASLVPWLIMIAAIHTIVIYKSTGRSLKVSLIFVALTYIFIWYSTFLTRTGVLGETSVHAFTDAGKALYYHLLLVIAILAGMSLWALISKWRKMPKIAGEEATSSREFWMLIGSVTLLLSSLLIIFYTSVPIWATAWKLVSDNEITIEDPVSFYNKQQVWFAVLIGILSGAVQFLKYKKTEMRKLGVLLVLQVIIAALLTVLLVMVQKVQGMALIAFSFASIFAIIANVFYIVSFQKFQLKKAGGAMTHLAFGLMLLAILFSSYKKEIISMNSTGQVSDFGFETYQENLKESRENVLLFRNTPYPMGQYMVTYLGDSVVDNDPPINYFKIRFEKRDPGTNELLETFYLYPNVFVNTQGKEGLGSNPAARNYLTRDVFTYISSTSDPEQKKEEVNFRPFVLQVSDTVFMANGYLVYEGLRSNASDPASNSVAAIATLSAYDIHGKLGEVHPVYQITGNSVTARNDTLNSFGIIANISKIDPETESVEFNIFQRGQQDDFIVIKVIVYPFIGLLWFSIVLMFMGFIVSLIYRSRK
ncbi:MAG: cytochrome c biogenesis protein CcsA [Taibaiella sp.]|nr:cytochrome c biogenesis protein CcsA [Taibaiella sp.]